MKGINKRILKNTDARAVLGRRLFSLELHELIDIALALRKEGPIYLGGTEFQSYDTRQNRLVRNVGDQLEGGDRYMLGAILLNTIPPEGTNIYGTEIAACGNWEFDRRITFQYSRIADLMKSGKIAVVDRRNKMEEYHFWVDGDRPSSGEWVKVKPGDNPVAAFQERYNYRGNLHVIKHDGGSYDLIKVGSDEERFKINALKKTSEQVIYAIK